MVRKKKNGRPTVFDQKIANVICKRIINGESLNTICSDKAIPCRASVFNWLANKKHKTFLDQYTYARERQAETFIDQCVDIADDNENDEIEVMGKDGKPYIRVNHDHINRSRLRVDTRIKIAEKLAPKKYTPKNEISGPEQGPIEITPDETLRRLAFMLRNKEEDKKG